MEYPELAQLQFAQIKNSVYDSETSPFHSVNVISGSTRAMTDGWRLTDMNLKYFENTSVEERLTTLIHEVAHANSGGYGKGVANHGVDFWEEYAFILNEILDDEKKRRMINSVFHEDIDWGRVVYRSVQNVGAYDGRVFNSIEGQSRKLAEDLGYEYYDKFEGTNYGFSAGKYERLPMRDPCAVHVPNEGKIATEFTDEEMLEFMDKHRSEDGSVVIPPVFVWTWTDEVDYENGEENQTPDPSNVKLAFNDTDTRKRLAIQDRLGVNMFYCTDLEAAIEGHLPGDTVPDDVDLDYYNKPHEAIASDKFYLVRS